MRQKERRSEGKVLSEEEQKEEEYEMLEARQVYLDDDNQDSRLF